MAYPELDAYDAFLSSGFAEFLEDPLLRAENPTAMERLSPDREATRLLFEQAGLSLWTWEYWEGSRARKWVFGFDDEKHVHLFALIGIFRRALIQSRMLILFVANRRGSQITPWPDGLDTYGTFLELEIFFAVATGKPIILLREEGGTLDPPLEALLAIARQSGAVQHEERIARRDLPARSHAAYHRVDAALKSRSRRFTTLLAIRRDPKFDFRRIAPSFFDRPLPRLTGRPDLNMEVIDRLLKEEAAPGLTISDRMSRLWLALQEMMSGGALVARDPALADRWLMALDRWSSAASWFGLHAHMMVSPITVQSQRGRFILSHPAPGRFQPHGALASARYSIGRREALGLRRMREFAKVVEETKSALALGHGDRAGYLSIMGHAFMQNGRLLAARSVFEDSLRERQAEQADQRIGEGMVDLGFILFLTLQYHKGVRMMEDGIALLESDADSGFLLKSLKKLELAYRLTGRREKAAALGAQRARQALADEAFDQL